MGPAGRELDKALEAAGIDRDEVYVTNAVKHKSRGRPLESDLAPLVTATAHPSSILRQRDDAARHAERRHFTEDLERVVAMLGDLSARAR